jgi:hypothetical protein
VINDHGKWKENVKLFFHTQRPHVQQRLQPGRHIEIGGFPEKQDVWSEQGGRDFTFQKQ